MADNFSLPKKEYCSFKNVPEKTKHYFHLLSRESHPTQSLR
jgi:hypothetical protein